MVKYQCPINQSWIMLLRFAMLVTAAASTDPTKVDVAIQSMDVDGGATISPYLASMSLVYSWAPDAVYANGSIIAWANRTGLKTARYPAGTASYWNWENPTGQMGNSSLNPDWHGTPSPAEDWMSLEKYLNLCQAAHLTPLIGVNYNCKNQFWVNESESIARAQRQVQFVLNKGFAGALWYIGNEDGSTEPGNPERIREHALAMKKLDPTMKIFFNDNGLNPNALEKFLKVVGTAIDGGEFHGKWPQGGSAGTSHTYTEWLSEVPLIEHKSGETWRHKIQALRNTTKQLGRPDFLLANNEYGLGKPNVLVGFTRFTKSLVVTEFALEMYLSGYDVAAFWDNGDGGNLDHNDQMLISTEHDYRFNPMHFGLEFLARSANQKMLTMTTSEDRVHGFAAYDKSVNAVLCYLINKYETNMTVDISLALHPAKTPASATAEAMVDTLDHWGAVVLVDVVCQQSACAVVLPNASFTVLTLQF
eukprot:m.189837 g.189837  ORF g.189837 m.189837 type:complete len:476 (-) comp32388_c2_seq2:159-1586(-)